MHALYSTGVYPGKLILHPNTTYFNMDYRQKMIVSTNKKYRNEDDDDEDLEALRLAALKSVRAKPIPSVKPQPTLPQQHVMHTGRSHFVSYNQRFGRREYYHPNRPPRQNGNIYHPSRVNQNLIEIIPVEESTVLPTSENKTTFDPLSTTDVTEDSKFQRYTNDISGSDEEDLKDSKNLPISDSTAEEKKDPQDDETGTDKENQSEKENSSSNNEDPDLLEDPEEEDEKETEDDDDILLMADIEEENSLERLMDEMEREMNVDKSPADKKEKKPSKKDPKDSKRPHDPSKSRTNRNRPDKIENPSIGSTKNERNDRRSVSPYSTSKQIPRHRSLSPKQKPRKKSPRRSPPRQLKKFQREPLRLQPPRKSPPRYSPRPRSPRSPRMSPHRSPNRSPIRRLSPRGRSHSRSPRPRRSRSPKILSRPHSPRFINRTRSPLRMSPGRSPLPRSPRQSPHRLSPMRRASPRRSRSPKLSPRRPSPMRRLSPRISPRRSPWSSPRNSPRLSPRRRRSPPKERKRRSPSLEDNPFHPKENSPIRKNSSPEFVSKQKTKSGSKDISEISSDPVLEARRRKFESTKPIDPVTANKKIKLSKKEESKVDTPDDTVHLQSPKRKAREIVEEYEVIPDEELSLHEDYDFDLEQILSDVSDGPVMCVSPVKVEKEKVKKKKKKDKEIYQVGKMKDAALAGRVVKEKKCKKKKKEVTPEVAEDVVETVGEEAVDEEVDLRTELSRKRAERLNRTVPIPPARLLQSAFKGVVNEAAKNNAKVIQRHLGKSDDKPSQKEVRRVTVVHRTVTDLSDSEDTMDSKMPVRFRLGMNKPVQESRESKVSRKSSKRLGRKVKHKSNLSVSDNDRPK